MLSGVLRQKRPLDTIAGEALSGADLTPRDAAFARAIATTALRRFGQLEVVVRRFVPKAPAPHKAGPALEILILGACELLFLGVPPHAAVDGANRLAEGDTKAIHFKPLINAVLRRLATEGREAVAGQDAARLDTPDWLWASWTHTYGERLARAFAEAHLAVPPLDLTLKSRDDPCSDFLGAPLRLAPGRVRLRDAGRVEDIPGFKDGRWWVQDYAASLPIELLGEVSGQEVIDLCAAPGGKTLQLAARAARVTAVDVAPDRLRRISDNLSRARLGADLVAADAREWRPKQRSPFVLLDAPCTATGTIRRHPDLPWLKSPADVCICETVQDDLLDAAADMTAVGGLLVYAVCSLEEAEGPNRVQAFLRRHGDFVRRPISAGGMIVQEFVSKDGDLRTLPCHCADKGGMDGFYAARLQRVA